jgi:hypothetical protein
MVSRLSLVSVRNSLNRSSMTTAFADGSSRAARRLSVFG